MRLPKSKPYNYIKKHTNISHNVFVFILLSTRKSILGQVVSKAVKTIRSVSHPNRSALIWIPTLLLVPISFKNARPGKQKWSLQWRGCCYASVGDLDISFLAQLSASARSRSGHYRQVGGGRWGKSRGWEFFLFVFLSVSAFPINKVTSYKYLPPNLNVSTMLPRGLYHMGTRTSSASATLWISYFYYRKAILMVNLLNILSSMAWENSQRQSSRQELKTCRQTQPLLYNSPCALFKHVSYGLKKEKCHKSTYILK